MPTPEEAAADLAKKVADAAKVFADAEYARAQADKQRADAEKVRSDLEADRRLAQNKFDIAAQDLEAKQMANRAAHDQAVGARTDKLIEQLTGTVPDLASIEKSTVTFRDGKALRQGEAVSVALTRVAADVAKAVITAKNRLGADSVFVTGDPDLVSAVAAYRQVLFEARHLHSKVQEALAEATKTLDAAMPENDDEVRMGFAVAEAGIVAAAVAGKAITQLASLFQIDVDVATSTTELTGGSVQLAVMQQIAAADADVTIHHAWARMVKADTSELLKALQQLTTSDVGATTVGARLDSAIETLGDPGTRLAQAEKVIKDEKASEDEREAASEAAREARRALVRLAALQRASTDLVAVLGKARAFAERVTAAPQTNGTSVLAKALSIEPAAAEGSKALVLCLQGGTAETNQIVVRRRIRWPRLQTSTSVEVDYLMVSAENGRAWGGHATASVTYAGVVNHKGADWKPLTHYALPSSPPTAPAPAESTPSDT